MRLARERAYRKRGITPPERKGAARRPLPVPDSVVRELARETPERLVELLAFAEATHRTSPIAADAHAGGVTHVAVTASNQVLLNLCVEGTYVEQLGCPAGNVTIVSLH